MLAIARSLQHAESLSLSDPHAIGLRLVEVSFEALEGRFDRRILTAFSCTPRPINWHLPLRDYPFLIFHRRC